MKLTRNQKIALIVVLALLDAWGLYESRKRTYTKLYRAAVASA